MSGLRKWKRRERLEREKGIDNDPEHHAVLFQLRLLDDDDNCKLFFEMRNEDDELGDVSPEQWGSYMRSRDEQTLAARLGIAFRMLRTMPDDEARRERFVEHFIRSEYGRLQAEAALRIMAIRTLKVS